MSFAVLVTLEGKVFPKVPEVALLFSQQGNYVWAVTEDSKARKVPVVLVRRVDSEVLIDGALTPGSLVVVEGVQRLRPGRAVKHDGTPDAKQSNPLARSANGQRS
jgi:multidrug efflux pump subunit AcrA (membrane-fusion protein)